jgi:hypothetical protein
LQFCKLISTNATVENFCFAAQRSARLTRRLAAACFVGTKKTDLPVSLSSPTSRGLACFSPADDADVRQVATHPDPTWLQGCLMVYFQTKSQFGQIFECLRL